MRGRTRGRTASTGTPPTLTTTAPRSYNTRTPMMALPVWVQECPCMPGLVWYAGDPDECAGKRERAAWDRCVGFEVNAIERCGALGSSTPSVSTTARALRARAEPAGQSGVDG